MKKERERNYELLRVIAMIMIVSLHYLGKGGALGNPSGGLSPVGYTSWLLEAFCLASVNVYILISGYFGIGEKKDNIITCVMKRPLRIWRQVMFYSVVIGVLCLIIGAQSFDIYTVFTYVFPTVTEHYWFATSYLLLTLLMPFLNSGFDRIDKRSMQGILFAMLLIFSLAKTLLPMHLPWDKKGYDVLWFLFLYLTGAYLRRYGAAWLTSRAKAIALYVTGSLFTFASLLVVRYLYLHYGILGDFISYGYSYNFFFCYLASIGLFLSFQSNGKAEKAASCPPLLQKISGATFGVYLIHEHVNLRYLWPKWFQCGRFCEASVPVFLLHMIFTVAVVYLVCTGIELLRSTAAQKLCRRN